MGNKTNTRKIVTIVLMLSIICLTLGTSFAFFQYVERGNTINFIETGDVIFRYDEGASAGNGIALIDALPMTDSEGKILQAGHQAFDFQVYTNIINAPLEYQIIADKQLDTTLPDEYVKIYLTTVSGSVETPVAGSILGDGKVTSFNMLTETTFPGQTGKVIHKETMNNKKSYAKDYRLRMWIGENTDMSNSDYLSKRFAIKIHVFAQSV